MCIRDSFHWNDVFGEYLSINAVTNDAVDPISRQPEYKACAITLTKVAAAQPDSGPEQISPSQVDAFAEIIGLANEPAPQFGPLGRSYLAGLIAGLRSEAGRRAAGVPTVPMSAPFDSATRLWVDGLLAGIFARTEAPAETTLAPPDTPASPTRAPIVVLWASQTGNAEELAGDIAARLAVAGGAGDQQQLPRRGQVGEWEVVHAMQRDG